MCCDYRIMTSDVAGATIGLNEVALGISVPRYWVQLYIQQLGVLRAEQSLFTGRMMTPEQALSGGLLHQLTAKAALMAEAEKTMATYLRNPDAGRIATKLDARRTFAQQWQGYCSEEAANAWNSQQHGDCSGDGWRAAAPVWRPHAMLLYLTCALIAALACPAALLTVLSSPPITAALGGVLARLSGGAAPAKAKL